MILNGKYPHITCGKSYKTNVRSIFCDLCEKWIHFKCSFLTSEQFDSLQNFDISYFCTKCNCDILVFRNVNDEEFSNNLTVKEFAMSKMDIISKILQVTLNNVACNNQYLNTQDFKKQICQNHQFFKFCM